jgi:hypothetical protein
MSDRYHYDRHGNYRGMSSNTPPRDGSWVFIGCLVGIVVVFCIFGVIGAVLAIVGSLIHLLFLRPGKR